MDSPLSIDHRSHAQGNIAALELGAGFRLPMLARVLTQFFVIVVAVAIAMSEDAIIWRPIALPIAAVALVAGPASGRRLLSKGASLTVGPDAMVIEHPLLRQAFSLARTQVRAVAFDDGDFDHGRFGVRSSFSFSAPNAGQSETGKLVAALAGPRRERAHVGSIFPILGTNAQQPNVAIVFRSPVRLPVIRSWQRIGTQTPRFGELRAPTVVLLIAVRDSEHLRQLIAPWEVERGLVEDDLDPDLPSLGIDDDASDHRQPETTPIVHAASERSRRLMALTLALGFYVLVTGFGMGILFGAALMWSSGAINGRGAAVLWSFFGIATLANLIPRTDRTPDAGVSVTPTTQPRLWDLVRRVALAVGEPVPHEVLVIHSSNAYVHESGGFKNARILALGLPFIATMTERELMSVIAHEFGHFRGGDTRVGRIVLSTLRTMQRSIEPRHFSGSAWQNVLHPLVAYLKFFLRVTSRMRRQEEFSADRVAVAIAGVQPTRSAAVKAVMTGEAMHAFWTSEMRPALDSHRRPPFMEGLQRFIREPTTAAALAKRTDELIASESVGPYDHHPLTRDRLRNIGIDESPSDGSLPAMKLLRNIDALEVAVLSAEFGDELLEGVSPIEWDDVVPTVFLGPWRDHIREIGHRLSDITIGDLPRHTATPAVFAGRMGATDPREIAPEFATAGMVQTLGMALCVTLADSGFHIGGEPGGKVIARRGAAAIAPYDVIQRMAAGAIDPERWRIKCEHQDVAALTLGAPLTTTDPVDSPHELSTARARE